MAATPEAAGAVAKSRRPLADAFAVYLKRRVLIVLFLGFSSGLPLALSGSTLLVWMRESGVNLGTIGLFALVGTPYTIKFLWAPLIDALDVPVLSRLLRPPPRLAVAVAVLADRRDRFSRRSAIRRRRRSSSRWARCWSPPLRRPRTSSSMRSASRAWTRASRRPAWRPMSPPIASACWSRPPARCSSSAASKAPASTITPRGRAGYVVMAAFVLIGIATTLMRDRAGKVGCCRAVHAAPDFACARHRSGGRRLFRVSVARHGVSSRSLLWCCSSSPTRCPAR